MGTEPSRAQWVQWRSDPPRFAYQMLRLNPWKAQRDIMRAIAVHDRVTVRSGHKIGKSTSAVAIALWHTAVFPRSRVIMTSASARQVKSILWRELKRVWRMGSLTFAGVKFHEDPNSGLQLPDGREIVGFSTNEPERMAGISGDQILFLVDEASGVPEEIFEAIEGNRAGGAKILLYSNPTQTAGTFFDAFHSKKEFWHTVHVSSAHTPNVLQERIVLPGLATHAWVTEKQNEWGLESALYQVRVEGNFPTQGENVVIGLGLIEAALERYRAWEEEPGEMRGALEVGVDVARYGDDETVIQPVRGHLPLVPRVLRSLDGPEVAGEVIGLVRQLRRSGEPVRVKVDVIGYGASCYDALKHSDDARALGIEPVDVNVAERATDDTYERLRDQLWFSLKAWLADGGMLRPDDALQAELAAPTYGFSLRGRQQVSDKDRMKQVLGRSPDRADALALAVYMPAPGSNFEALSKLGIAGVQGR